MVVGMLAGCSAQTKKQGIPVRVLILPVFEAGELTGDFPGEAQYFYEKYLAGVTPEKLWDPAADDHLASDDSMESVLKGEFDDCKKWISSLYTPLSWNYKDDWYLWQYLNRGELEGYSGGEKYIDLNVLNKEKSLEDLIVK